MLIAVISRRVPRRWNLFRAHDPAGPGIQPASRVQTETGGIIAFGMGGLACSAFLPLSISFGGKEFPRLSAVMPEADCVYQIGYGVAAFGIGPLHDLFGLPFSTIFASGSIVAALLAVIALFVVRRPPASRLGEQ